MMSPENYRGMLQRANVLSDEIEYYVEGITASGNIIPIVCFNQIEGYKQKLHETISECRIAVRNLKTPGKRDQYSDVLRRLQACLDQLIAFENKTRY